MSYRKLVLVVIVLLSLARPIWAEDIQTVSQESAGSVKETAQSNLKERQEFNKLKRSTRNIYKVTMRSTVAFRLQTALGYISTIDLPEKALKVFVGDQELFKVEVYERQVLIKPITDESAARTNLVIVTDSNRLAFDVNVGPPETADFVLDFRLPQDDSSIVQNAFDQKVEENKKELEKTYQQKEENLEKKADELSAQKLKEKVASGVQTIELKKSKGQGNIQVNLLSLSHLADKAYLRFSVLNYSKTPFKLLKAMVAVITFERKFLKNEESGLIELPSEIQLPAVINPDSYEYGVLVFDYRVLAKREKPVFRITEDGNEGRNIEIRDFGWFK